MQNKVEIEHARAICRHYDVKLREIDLSFFRDNFKSSLLDGNIVDGASTIVPFRNAVLASIAVGTAASNSIDEVVLANHFSDDATYPDCRRQFISAMSEAASYGTDHKVMLSSPFCNMTKSEVVGLGKRMGLDFSLTYSCYRGGPVHCGTCPTCIERKRAFEEANIEDITEYLT